MYTYSYHCYVIWEFALKKIILLIFGFDVFHFAAIQFFQAILTKDFRRSIIEKLDSFVYWNMYSVQLEWKKKANE